MPTVKRYFCLHLTSVLLSRYVFSYTLFFHNNVVFPAQAEYSYFSANFRLKILLYYSYIIAYDISVLEYYKCLVSGSGSRYIIVYVLHSEANMSRQTTLSRFGFEKSISQRNSVMETKYSIFFQLCQGQLSVIS